MLLGIDNYEEQIRNFSGILRGQQAEVALRCERVYVIGAGANYGTALEGAVKIGETVHTVAVGSGGGRGRPWTAQIQLTANHDPVLH